MRTAFHTELDGLLNNLAMMIRQTGDMITNASIAVHQTDRALAARVIAEGDELNVSLAAMERIRCLPAGSPVGSGRFRWPPREGRLRS